MVQLSQQQVVTHTFCCVFSESCFGAGSALYPTLIVIHDYLRLCVFDGNR
jgi:hypothetical protein